MAVLLWDKANSVNVKKLLGQTNNTEMQQYVLSPQFIIKKTSKPKPEKNQ